MATSAFSIEPLVAPTLRATDIDSVRMFLKKYREYVELWIECQEEGTIDEEKQPKILLRCADIYLRDRISKYELGKPKSYKLKLTDLEAYLSNLLESD